MSCTNYVMMLVYMFIKFVCILYVMLLLVEFACMHVHSIAIVECGARKS